MGILSDPTPDHPLMTGERGGMEEVPPEDWEIPF
ncbi:Uncharacterised protein [Collinsella aerofaciens]|uniref:Uncharacterized protein n=1 Tax=Collinsella aerofaciens TaxID=74426 RepID=A0A174DIK4_9ACTN|nr:Uncharacterised protein [Collinsella aerofaciens]